MASKEVINAIAQATGQPKSVVKSILSTGEKVFIKGHRAVKFRASKLIKNALKGDGE